MALKHAIALWSAYGSCPFYLDIANVLASRKNVVKRVDDDAIPILDRQVEHGQVDEHVQQVPDEAALTADKIELFSEIVDDTLSVYTRDRGAGFDTSRVDPTRGIGRHIAKVEDAGGETTIFSQRGEGTETTFTMAMP